MAQRAASAGVLPPCARAAGGAARPGCSGGRGQARASAAPSAAFASQRQHLQRRNCKPRSPRANHRVPPLGAQPGRTWGRFPAACARLPRQRRRRRQRPPRWPRARCAASRSPRTRTGSRGPGRSTALGDAEQRKARQVRGAFEGNCAFFEAERHAPSSSAKRAPARLRSLPIAAEEERGKGDVSRLTVSVGTPRPTQFASTLPSGF